MQIFVLQWVASLGAILVSVATGSFNNAAFFQEEAAGVLTGSDFNFLVVLTSLVLWQVHPIYTNVSRRKIVYIGIHFSLGHW